MGELFKHAYGRVRLLKVEFCHICTGIAWLLFPGSGRFITLCSFYLLHVDI